MKRNFRTRNLLRSARIPGFGFNAIGVIIAHVMGYTLASFTTFVTILGRYNYRLAGIMYYNYSILLSVPLAYVAGAFTAVVREAYRKIRSEYQ
jgi:hypothetical protein